MNSTNLVWTQEYLPDNRILHSASIIDTDENNIRQAVHLCTDKAVSLLASNIQDESLYLLFEWHAETCTLKILVTDALKQQDSPEIVLCSMTALANTFCNLNDSHNYQHSQEELTENIKYWLHDYLTTCTGFFRYSLVAIFHNSSRDNTELL